MEPYYKGLSNKLDNDKKRVLKELISILKDKKWHDIFEFHDKHRISPIELIQSMDFLNEHGLIDVLDRSIRLSLCIDNKGVLLMNRLMKTEPPVSLSVCRF